MIYLDAGIVMRLVEGASAVRAPIEARLGAIPDAERILVTSRLSRLECRCKPLKEKRTDRLALYEGFFSSAEVRLREIDSAVIETATTHSCQHRLQKRGRNSSSDGHLGLQLPSSGRRTTDSCVVYRSKDHRFPRRLMKSAAETLLSGTRLTAAKE